MNKRDIVNSLNKKIKQISEEYTVIIDGGDLCLTVEDCDWKICKFNSFIEEGFSFDCTAFRDSLEDLIVDGRPCNKRLEVARIFYIEGCVLLDNLYASGSNIVGTLNGKIKEFDDEFGVCNVSGNLALESKEDEFILAHFTDFNPLSFRISPLLNLKIEHGIANGDSKLKKYTEVMDLFCEEAKPLLEELNNEQTRYHK